MKFKKILSYEEYSSLSEGFKYHLENDIPLDECIFRPGSDAYCKLHEEVKTYWDKNNIILKSPAGWKKKNLEIGKEAIYKGKRVKLDIPYKGGSKKFYVYRNSGKTDKDGNIKAKIIRWGDKNLSIKNDDEGAAASFWARHKCDSKEKMDPDKAGFWACYGPTLFKNELGLESDSPW